MTIAGIYLCPEGVVLGADSTSSIPTASGLQYFDFTQKVFEIGEEGTLGMLTWGLGGLTPISYRTLIAQLADQFQKHSPVSISEAAQQWLEIFWPYYSKWHGVVRCKKLNAADKPTREEIEECRKLKWGLVAGFCIAGYCLPDREPQAVSLVFDPLDPKPKPDLIVGEYQSWWGAPNIIERLIWGADKNLVDEILSSGKWKGTETELKEIIDGQRFDQGTLPIREAVDYVYSCIYATIKAMKFSNMPQICGGPIEIAVITTDRKFRWVRHKSWDAAIVEGGL